MARRLHHALEWTPLRFREFCDVLRDALPPDTAAVLRGSSVTGERWEDGAPFDVEGPGTSDLDLTLVGSDVIALFDPEHGFYVPGIHTKPLGEKDPTIAPGLLPLRRRSRGSRGAPSTSRRRATSSCCCGRCWCASRT